MAETIYALSSGHGRAGVAVIRISGPGAGRIPQLMADVVVAPRKARLVNLRRPGSGELIDKALLLFFAGPKSFTGEDVLELHVHGGRAVVSAVLDVLSTCAGLRAAEPGEFTRRAFANGKLDLTSAEGLADLISADTDLQRQRALRQLSGALNDQCRSWRKILLESQALIEAHLDFPDEEEIPGDVSDELRQSLTLLLHSFEASIRGRDSAEILRDGAVVLIAGPPNAGKSTLLNRIARREVAITSEIAGTTRDLIEITIDLRGIPVTFVDSAGIRQTSDPLESIGVSRTRERASVAHLTLWLSPLDDPAPVPGIEAQHLKTIGSKRDRIVSDPAQLSVSGVTGEGLDDLLDFVYQFFGERLGSEEGGLLSSQRQFECMEDAAVSLRAAVSQIDNRRLELAAEELRLASRRLQELTGEIKVEEMLDEVFGRFCLGK